MADNITSLYNIATEKHLLKDGMTEEAFRQQTSTEEGRKSFYDYAQKRGLKMRPYEEYTQKYFSQDTQTEEQDAQEQAIEEQTTEKSLAQSIGAHNPYAYQTQQAQKEQEKAEQSAREEKATLPLSVQDKEREEELHKEQVEGTWGKSNGITMGIDKQTGLPVITKTEGDGMHLSTGATPANQDRIDQLKTERPSYIAREIRTPQDLYTSVSEAWSANTEEGRKAKAELDKTTQDTYDNLLTDLNKQVADLQQQVANGTLSKEEAQRQAEQAAQNANAIYENETKLAQDYFFRQMTEANKDYLSKQTRILGQNATNKTIEDINARITPQIQQLQEDYQREVAQYNRGNRGGAYGAIGAQMSTNITRDPEKAQELELYRQSQQFLADAAKISQAAQEGHGFGKALGSALTDEDTWDFGISQLVRSVNLKNIVEKYEKGEQLTDAEKGLMDSAVAYISACAYNSDKLSRAYKAGQTTGESIPFMLQFMVMPIDAVKNKVAKGILGYGIEQFGGKTLQTAGKTATRYTAGQAFKEAGTALLGNIAAAGMQTAAFGVPKIAEGTISRMTGDITPTYDENGNIVYGGRQNKQGAAEAAWNATVDTYVENLSEMVLTTFDPLKAYVGTTKLFKGLTNSQIAQVLSRIDNSVIGKIRERAQFRNYVEEVGEEYVGNLMKWGASTDINSADEAGFSIDQQIDTWLGLAPTSILFGMASLTSGGIDLFQTSQAAKELRKIMESGEQRKYLDNLLNSKNSDAFSKNAHDVVKTVLRDKSLNEEYKRFILDGIYGTYQSQLAKEAEKTKAQEEVEQAEEPIEQQTEPTQETPQPGQNTPQEGVERYRDKNNEEVEIQRNTDGSVAFLDEKGNAMVDEQGNVIVMSTDEFNQFAADSQLTRIDPQTEQTQQIRQQAEQEVALITNKNDGKVYEVVRADDETKKGHIVSGNVEIDTTDPDALHITNNDVVTVRYEDGTVEQLPAKDLDIAGAPVTAEQAVQLFVEAETQQQPEQQPAQEQQESSAINNSTDTADTLAGKRNDTATPQNTANSSADKGTTNNSNTVKPDIDNMDANTLGTAAVEYMKGDKNTAKAYLQAEKDKAEAEVKRLKRVKVTKYTDIDDFMAQQAELDKQKKDAQVRLAKLDAAITYANGYKTQAEQQAAAEQAERDKQKHDERRQTYIAQTANSAPAEKWNNAPKTIGNTVTRTLADGTVIKGHYVLTEAGAATPSHDPLNGWNTSNGFPTTENGGNINDRDYKNDKDAQQITTQIAQTYDGQAVAQVPVVSSEGIVYDGNGRTIAGNLAAVNNTDAKYVQALSDNATNFGFTPEQVASMEHPRVYMQLDVDLPYNTTTFAKFNAQEKKSQSSMNRAVSNSKKVTDAARTALLEILNDYSSLDAFFASEKGAHDIIQTLIDHGIITQQEVAGLIEPTGVGTNFVLSPTGKDYITDLLIGTLFDEQTIKLLGNDKGLKQSILRALPSIIDNRKLADSESGDYSLTKEINGAIRLLYEARNAGLPYQHFILQVDAFEGKVSDRYSAFEMLLAQEMSAGVETFRQVLDRYNKSAETEANGAQNMFGNRTVEEIKNEILQYYGKQQQAGQQPANQQTQPTVSSTPAGNAGETATPAIDISASDTLKQIEAEAVPFEDIDLTPENWYALFGEDGIVSTPIGDVKMGENQYLKLAQKGRDGKLGMVKPTLEHPSVIIEDKSEAKEGQVTERDYSYVFVKAFTGKNGKRIYYFASVTVSKDGKEVVVSNQEKTANRIAKLIEQNKLVWLNNSSLHPTSQVEESVPLNRSHKPTQTDSQLVGLGINPSGKNTNVGSLPAVESSTNPETTEVNSGSDKGTNRASGNSSQTSSADKGTTSVPNNQTSEQKSVEDNQNNAHETPTTHLRDNSKQTKQHSTTPKTFPAIQTDTDSETRQAAIQIQQVEHLPKEINPKSIIEVVAKNGETVQVAFNGDDLYVQHNGKTYVVHDARQHAIHDIALAIFNTRDNTFATERIEALIDALYKADTIEHLKAMRAGNAASQKASANFNADTTDAEIHASVELSEKPERDFADWINTLSAGYIRRVGIGLTGGNTLEAMRAMGIVRRAFQSKAKEEVKDQVTRYAKTLEQAKWVAVEYADNYIYPDLDIYGSGMKENREAIENFAEQCFNELQAERQAEQEHELQKPLTREQKQSLIHDIADGNTKVALVTNKTLVKKMTELGATRKDIADAISALTQGLTVKGFYLNGTVILNSDALNTGMDIIQTFVHERQHLLTKNNPQILDTIIDNLSADQLAKLLQTIAKAPFYNRYNDGTENGHRALADEFLSHIMQEAYATDQDADAVAQQYGITNQDILTTLHNLDYEQRQSDNLSKARRNVLVSRSSNNRGGKSSRDSQTRTQQVDEQRPRSNQPRNSTSPTGGQTSQNGVEQTLFSATNSQSLAQLNDQFNNELARFAKGEMKKNEMLHLGQPHGVMRIFLPNLPIVMRQHILTKASVSKHNVAIEALTDMPKHISQPIFVFERSKETLGILTEMKDRDDKNVCVAIELQKTIQDGGDMLEVNDIRSIHGRNVEDIVYPIVQNKTLKWCDKEKGLAYLSSASQYAQQEIDKQALDLAAKIVQNFENPKLPEENDTLFSVSSYAPETDNTLTETARQEMQAIRDEAIANGTYMIEPNGNRTNLTERQWLQTRTQAFKKWFGDWLLVEKAKAIKGMNAIAIAENSLGREEIKEAYRNIGEVTNKFDGRKATFYHGVFGKMYKDGGLFAQVVPQLNNLFENSILAYTESDNLAGAQREDGTIHKEHRNIISYDNYVAKAEINGKEYYVRFTVQNENDGRRGNHSLMVTNVALYENNNTTNVASTPTKTGERLDIDSITDAKLQQFFESAKSAEQNCSKIVDENGAPLLVYHGTNRNTRSRFFQFRTTNGSVWVTPSKGYADIFAEDGEGKPTLYPLFATIHNPAYVGYIGSRIDEDKLQRLADELNIPLAELARIAELATYTWELTASKPFADLIGKYGYDGIQAREGAVDTYAVLSPNQIKSATDNNGSFDNADNDIRFQIIGEQGAANLDKAEEATTRLDNLQVARDMEQAGKDAKAIRLATGWERGADNKWRYEIPDIQWRKSKYAPLEKELQAQPWYDEYKELERRYNNGEDLNDKERNLYFELQFDERQMANKYLDNLDFSIDAPELFKAYPQLRDIKLDYDAYLIQTRGYYNYPTNTITLNREYSADKSVWAHEIQHAIQYIEGFAKGGNMYTVRKELEQLVSDNRDYAEYATQAKEEFLHLAELAGLLKNVYPKLINSGIEDYKQLAVDMYWKAMDELGNNPSSKFLDLYDDLVHDGETPTEVAKLGRKIPEAIDELNRLADERKPSKTMMSAKKLVDKLNAALKDYTDAQLYTALAGEVESRNVQKRLSLTPEQRRKTLLRETEDVAREDQLFLDESLSSASLSSEPYDYDAYPYGRVEPNLANKEVEIVTTDANHGFANYNDARAWAKQNIAKTYNNEQTGGKGDIRISNAAIDKYLSQSSVDKSDTKDVHFAALKVLPKLLRTSIDVETHPDFLKGTDGKRTATNDINKDVLIHRCYGAVNIGDNTYRVKITLKENVKTKETANAHSYEATKIELLDGQHGGVTMTPPRNSNNSKEKLLAGTLVKPNGDNPNTNNSISAAKLLQNVGMSYNPSVKVLEQSKERDNEILFSVFGGNSGYIGYSKSVRAAEAEADGKRSISHFDKEFVDNVNAILQSVGAEPINITQAKQLAKDATPDEWHHTSMYGNKTNYYSPATIARSAMNETQKDAFDRAELTREQAEIEEYRKHADESIRQEQERMKQSLERNRAIQRAAAPVLEQRPEVNKWTSPATGITHYWINLDGVHVQVDSSLYEESRRYDEGVDKKAAKERANQYLAELRAEVNAIADEKETAYRAQQLATETLLTSLSDAGIEVEQVSQEHAQQVLAEQNNAELMAVTERFNDTLDKYTDENADNIKFDCGMPSEGLLLAGMPNLPIRLNGQTLRKKIKKHGFNAAELKDMPQYLQNPIAVFDGSQPDTFAVLVEMNINGSKSIVSIDIKNAEVDDLVLVSSVYDKNKNGIISWINDGKMLSVDKEKALRYIRTEAPIATADNNKGAISAAKVVQDFDTSKSFVGKNVDTPQFSIRTTPAPKKQRELLQLPNGIVYGYTENGKIYLTPEGLNPNTPIHEYSHLWVAAVKKRNPQLYKSLQDLFSRTNLPEMWNELDNDTHYSHLSDDAKLSEVISRYSSKQGAERMEQEAKQHIEDARKQGKKELANAISLRQRMRDLLKRFWNWVGENLFHLKNFGSREEAADRILYDLLNATNLKAGDTQEQADAETRFSVSPVPPKITGETTREWARRIADWRRQQLDQQHINEYKQLLERNQSKRSKLYKFIVDKFTAIDNFQQWILAHNGTYDPDTMDMHGDLSLAFGRIATFQRRYKDTYIQHIADNIAAIAKDKKLNDALLNLNLKWQNFEDKKTNGRPLTIREIMGVYAQAKDTQEAADNGLPDRGAQGFINNLGITHYELIDAVENALPKETIDNFWDAVYAANQFALDYQLQAGLIDQATRDRYERRYYVPQRGWRERDFDGYDTNYVPEGARLYGNPYNSALVKAHGRQSLASDPFALIESIGLTSISQSEHNRSKQQFLNLLLANENIGLKSGAWTVRQIYTKNIIDPTTGRVMRHADGTPFEAEVVYAAPTQAEREHDEKILAKIERLRKEQLKTPAAIAKRDVLIEDLQDQLIYVGRASDTMIEHRTRDEKRQHQVIVLKDGQQYLVELQDEALANAVNGNFGKAYNAYKLLNKLNTPAIRYMSGMLTQFNPRFASRNFWRDAQAAFINNMSELGVKFATKAAANIPMVQRTIWAYIWSDAYHDRETYSGMYGDYLREYFEAGAQTGFSFMPELERMAKDFDKMTKGDTKWDKVWNRGVKGTLSLLTEASELTVRFAQYVTARQLGYSTQEAAKMAKNITTNFNQSGILSKEMSKYFTFFNATVQGNMREMTPQGKNRPAYGKMALKFGAKLAGVAANFALLGLLSVYLNPDDPDDETWFTEYDRMSNFIVFGTKIPVVHFFRMFYAAGVQAALAAQGRKTWKDAALTATDYALSEITPTSVLQLHNMLDFNEATNELEFNATKYAQSAAPSVVSPVVDVLVNRDFKGSTVYRKKWDEQKKNITTAKRNTPQWAIDAANTLHEWSGGNPEVPYGGGRTDGWIDIKPNAIEHIAQGYLSGVWESLGHTAGFVYDAAAGGDDYKSITNYPFLRDLFRDYSEDKAYNQEFYKATDKMEAYRKRYNSMPREEQSIERKTDNYKTYQEVERKLLRLPNPLKDDKEVSSKDINAILQLNQQLNRNLFKDE